MQLGWTHAPTVRIPAKHAKAYRLADNRSGEFSTWDLDVLPGELEDIPSGQLEALPALGFDALVKPEPHSPHNDDKVPIAVRTRIKRGDMFTLGSHRIICGDATSEQDVERLLNGAEPNCILTDPPYCSGGFQESQRSVGSVGTNATHKQIANDRLSTRGYQALLRAAIQRQTTAKFVYVFTDWHMWVNLYDIVESCGFGVRSMICWNKDSPGTGRIWMPQHELILWACKETPPVPKHSPARGNVVTILRSGNVHHTTEKPVDLLGVILDNTPFAVGVVDPFLGSGSTIIAAEPRGVSVYGLELDPLYCQTSIDRWEAFTGRKATR